MTEQTGDIVADKVDDTTKTADDAGKAVEAGKDKAADASKASDAAKTGADKPASGEAAKEFVADSTKSDEENAAALAEFEKANPPKKDEAALPDNWRELAAGKDEDVLKLLKRYGSLSGVAKALVEKEKIIRSGKSKTSMPDPSDEKAMAAWRKEEGIPDDPTGYKLPETVTKRMVDEDKPILSSFTEFAHKKNAPPAVVEIASEWYVEMAEAAATKQAEEDRAASENAEDALRKDWAHGEYKANTTIAHRWIETVPGLGAKWAEARVDGRRLGDIPEFIAWASDMGRDKFGDVAFTTSDSERKHTARIEEIKKIIGTDEYYEKGLDKEYATLLEKELKRKK
ncbi:hypothetical protein [Mesorhizobium sp. ESP-6-2]|uniref:hypothetical protein n=1 Tax=Mesorhizobium sp. ESP-6-2 TaxID=2876625 RepID=UPI001CC9E0F4|nr:hypothetical protein [Mesorhizobium sp. ESP-6-2]MBZ9807692.1 hypothetical protein [Mesorhizobium sp. ESP-6-2]